MLQSVESAIFRGGLGSSTAGPCTVCNAGGDATPPRDHRCATPLQATPMIRNMADDWGGIGRRLADSVDRLLVWVAACWALVFSALLIYDLYLLAILLWQFATPIRPS